MRASRIRESGLNVQKEIDIHRGLSHSNIARFLHSFKDCEGNVEYYYIVMELYEGGTLQQFIQKRLNGRQGKENPPTFTSPVISEDQCIKFMKQIISAVKYLHQFNIMHRDLKPKNILLDKAGDLRVADFGLTTRVKHGGKNHTLCGTQGYISPEVLAGKAYGLETDIWTMGAVLYFMVTGVSNGQSEVRKAHYKIRIKIYFRNFLFA